MRSGLYVVFAVCMGFAVMTSGCAKKAATSQEAIETSKSMKTVNEQADYLVDQANQFVNSQKFDDAIQTAKYVLNNLDKESTGAKSVIEKATQQMKQAAQGAVSDMKKSLGSMGK